MLLPISPVGIRRTAVEDILETSHDTELTETAVTSQMIVTHHSLVGLFLDIRSVKNYLGKIIWKLTDMDAQDNILHLELKRNLRLKLSYKLKIIIYQETVSLCAPTKQEASLSSGERTKNYP